MTAIRSANAIASDPVSFNPQPNITQDRYNLWIKYKDGKILALRNFYVKMMGKDTIADMRNLNTLSKNQFLWKFNMSLKKSGVLGRWAELTAKNLDEGDVPAWNSPYNVLGDVLSRRFGLSAAAIGGTASSAVFPKHAYHSMSLMA